MRCKEIVLILLLTNLITNCLCQECIHVKREQYPYQAFVHVIIICSGALISSQHVIIIASCAHGPKEAKVYLGFPDFRSLISRKNDQPKEGIIQTSKQIIIHENYSKGLFKSYVNNIAIVILPKPVTFNPSIQPIALNEDSFVLNYATMTSWPTLLTGNIKSCNVKIIDTNICLDELTNFLPNEQFCINSDKTIRGRTFPFGSIITANNKLIGLIASNPICLINCPKYSVFINIFPFARWIQKHTVGEKGPTNIENRSTQNNNGLNISSTTESMQIQCSSIKTTYEKEILELRKLIEENNKQLKEEFQKINTNNANQLLNAIIQQKNETQQDIKIIKSESQECKSNIDKLMKSIEDYPKNTDQLFQYLKGNISQNHSEDVIQIYSKIALINSESSNHRTDNELNINLIKADQRNTDQKLQNITMEISQLKNDIQENISLIKKESNECKTEFEKQRKLIEGYQRDIDQKCQYFNGNVTEIRKEIQLYITLISTDTKKLRKDIENQMESIQNYQKNTNQKLQFMNDQAQRDNLVITDELQYLKDNISQQQQNELQQNIKLTKTELNEFKTSIEKETKQFQDIVDKKLQYLDESINQRMKKQEFELKNIEKYRILLEDQIKYIENNKSDIDQKLQHLSNRINMNMENMVDITHKLKDKTLNEDIVALNRKIINDEIKKETQYITNDIGRINRTIQNILHNISFDLPYPELS